MRFGFGKGFAVELLLAGSVLLGIGLFARVGNRPVRAASAPAKLALDYPSDGTIFPPEFPPPTFLWHEETDAATRWVVEIRFADGAHSLRVDAAGEHQRMGPIDPATVGGNQVIPLTPEQAAMRTWKPDSETWAQIKKHSTTAPATVTIKGFAADGNAQPVSAGSVTLTTSTDPVGAPVFYRDVPMMTTPTAANGVIQPLPPSAIPLIKWKLRSIGETESRTVMENLPTCANCHSFSPDGKTMGMDVDGPSNDKGLYAVVPVRKQMVIGDRETIRWSEMQEDLSEKSSAPVVKRFGFMSQVSSDSRHVITSIGPPKLGNSHDKENSAFVSGLSERVFDVNYNSQEFSQVFFPMRGILAWYDSVQKKLRPLPGADDPNFVQACAFWSPDGKYLIFSRAPAQDPYPPNAPKPTYANDPREPQIQYDLYRIPFNHGLGGKAEPIEGASQNGMSNNFPKVSPDGKWIVFVQNKTGLLMRPDSKLYIVPFAGGKARMLRANMWRMNSWHTFSPNGRWLAFSSKARSPYTQLMLTHIDADGNDSPAILVENTTAANRDVNIPEFVNIPPDGIEKIDPQATRIYRLARNAVELAAAGHKAEAADLWRQAVELDPSYARARFGLGNILNDLGQKQEALEQYRKGCALDPNNAEGLAALAVMLATNGELNDAIDAWRKSLAIDPANARAEAALGSAMVLSGNSQEGTAMMRKAVEMDPDSAEVRKVLGLALGRIGQMDEAVAQLQKAVDLSPEAAEYRYYLGSVLGQHGDTAGAIVALEAAVTMSKGNDWQYLAMLAREYDRAGRPQDAAQRAQEALNVAAAQHDEQTVAKLRNTLEHYRQRAAQTPAR